MLKSTFLFVLLFISLACLAQQKSTANILDKLKSKSATENKNILVYFSGSDWCAPCMKFKRDFIETDAFKSFAKERLLVYNADFPRKKANQLSKEETAENEKIAEVYNPNGYFPMIILINSSGKILKNWEGLPNVSLEEFLKEL